MSWLESIEKIDEGTTNGLVDKCQENGWIKRGGYDWQDDPYLEEYPYGFVRVGDIEDLRSVFASGNFAIRSGFLYDDLAFVQQVSGGDEWWTLKRVGNEGLATDWVDFESWSFEHCANLNHEGVEPKEFINNIRSMQMATPEQCSRLDYMLPDDAPEWGFSTATGVDFSGNPKTCRIFTATIDDYELRVYERPSFEGFAADVFDTKSKCLVDHSEGMESALDAAVRMVERAMRLASERANAPAIQRQAESLESRANAAMLASEAMSKTNPAQAKEPINK